jgi:hypothetical protein
LTDIPGNLALNLAANGLTALVGAIMTHQPDDLSVPELLHAALDKAVDEVTWQGPGRIEEVCLFLASAEAQSIVEQVYATRLLPSENAVRLKDIEAQFTRLLASYLVAPLRATLSSGHRLFLDVLTICDLVMAAATDAGALSGHEGLSNVRHRLILDQLTLINRNLSFLTAKGQLPSASDIRTFASSLRRQVAVRHRQIIPPNFDTVHKVNLTSIYVMPKFFTGRPTMELARSGEPRSDGDERGHPREITVPEYLAEAYRSVILGNPGGGKSTFIQYLCHQMGNGDPTYRLLGKDLCPLLVVLREYAAAKLTRGVSLLDFLEETASSKYMVPPPPKAIEYMLLNGLACVFFDGLDELLETSGRREISDDVDAFCTRFPTVPVIVTSREIGYDQAPLDEGRFPVHFIAPFGDDQTEEYVTKWFALDDRLSDEQRDARARDLLSGTRSVPDLRSAPLMLALICNIYRGPNSIPRNRPAVYEKCATMLFERWDQDRGINVDLPFQADVRPAMMQLAHWIYSDGNLQSGVTQGQLEAEASRYFQQRRYEDPVEADRAAATFVKFCRGRSWIFTDTGATTDEPMFQFTHRTFLEYFTARYLVWTNHSASALWRVLRPRILTGEWDMVAQLAVHIASLEMNESAEHFLNWLVSAGRRDSIARSRALSFAARSLSFLTPAPDSLRHVAEEITSHALRSAAGSSDSNWPLTDQGALLSGALGFLAQAAPENLSVVGNTMGAIGKKYVEEEDNKLAAVAFEMVGQIDFLQFIAGREIAVQDEFWGVVAPSLMSEVEQKGESIARGVFSVASQGWARALWSIGDLLDWFGPSRFLETVDFLIVPGTDRCIAERLLNYHFFGAEALSSRYVKLMTDLSLFGDRVLTYGLPWFAMPEVTRYPWNFAPLAPEQWHALEGPTLFGAIVLLASLVETERGQDRGLRHNIKGTFRDAPMRDVIVGVLDARDRLELLRGDDLPHAPILDPPQDDLLEGSTLEAPQKELLRQWMRREVDFVSG